MREVISRQLFTSTSSFSDSENAFFRKLNAPQYSREDINAPKKTIITQITKSGFPAEITLSVNILPSSLKVGFDVFLSSFIALPRTSAVRKFAASMDTKTAMPAPVQPNTARPTVPE